MIKHHSIMSNQGERVMDGLTSKILAIDYKNMDRFREISEEEIRKTIEDQKNANTKRKTKGDVKLFIDFLASKQELREPHNIPTKELDIFLSMFILAIRKKDGTEYEPDTLQSKLNSIRRHLLDGGYGSDINKATDFKQCQDVLTSKRKQLKSEGLGNKKRKAMPISDTEIGIFVEKGIIGLGSYYNMIISFFFSMVWTRELSSSQFQHHKYNHYHLRQR